MKRIAKILGWIVAVVAGLVVLLIGYIQMTYNNTSSRVPPSIVAVRDSATVARGEYLFKYSWQCWNCHASERNANASPRGGYYFDLRNIGPGFGEFYSRNITPDSATGIGSWTDGEIVQAIREGVNKDRHLLFPIMPVTWLNKISDDDALAIVAYLRSIPPVHHAVPDREVSLVTKALMAFNQLTAAPEVKEKIVAPPVGQTPEYGKYFATALAGCAECHTPFNLQNGQVYFDSLFAGGVIPFGRDEGEPIIAYARNLRSGAPGAVQGWTETQFMDAVVGGMRPDSTVLVPHMPYAHYKFLHKEDLAAAYLYLKSLDPIPRSTPLPEYSPEVAAAQGAERGKLLFEGRCQPCHGKEGKGAVPTNVALRDVAASIEDQDLRDFVSSGQPNLRMPSFTKTLSAEDLDDIIAYIRSWEKQ